MRCETDDNKDAHSRKQSPIISLKESIKIISEVLLNKLSPRIRSVLIIFDCLDTFRHRFHCQLVFCTYSLDVAGAKDLFAIIQRYQTCHRCRRCYVSHEELSTQWRYSLWHVEHTINLLRSRNLNSLLKKMTTRRGCYNSTLIREDILLSRKPSTLHIFQTNW